MYTGSFDGYTTTTIHHPYATVSAPTLSALLALFSRMAAFRSFKTAVWLASTFCSQYPKLAPHAPKTG